MFPFVPRALLLAPMEDVTDLSYRILCRELGADVVYTEFVNSDGLIRNCKRAAKKMNFLPEERPVGIQLYGQHLESMAEATRMAEEREPDVIDINAGCWVKKVAHRGAGAGLLKDPDHFEALVKEVVKSTRLPVTVKTRLGWDEQSIQVLEIAKRIEGAGAKALTLHCRTRSQGHSGEADWSWIARVKEVVSIPVYLNGNVMEAADAVRAFETTPADGVMIARGSIGRPWIFREAKELLAGRAPRRIDLREKVDLCLRHLRLHLEQKGERAGVPSFRKFYVGYLKGHFGSNKVRIEMMAFTSYAQVEERLLRYVHDAHEADEELARTGGIPPSEVPLPEPELGPSVCL